ncbi:MAG: hypothetical protein H7833_20130 [Magnetococcus sp. DMHC-1]|nr:cytidine 5'-phosphate N-acetylneuraminic acid synthetase [Magnetococcales bacterium]
MSSICVMIPAIKKNVAFTDDLVKKLAGIPLILRAINKAKELTDPEQVHVVTDSMEIHLLAQRHAVHSFHDKDLDLLRPGFPRSMRFFLGRIARRHTCVVLLSPYAPLLTAATIKQAIQIFQETGCDLLLPLSMQRYRGGTTHLPDMQELLLAAKQQLLFVESRSFRIFNPTRILQNTPQSAWRIQPFLLESGLPEIADFQDWWICEKIIRRRRIVFRVVVDATKGTGHIFRAMALAHEITDHEIVFVCNDLHHETVKKLAGFDYRLDVFSDSEMVDSILRLKPDMVVNDILDTDAAYIDRLHQAGIKVVNFEDLGSGAPLADLTINELYDEPQIQGHTIHWGHGYFFLRDEFNDARPHRFREKVESILVTFGGTDPNDFTRKIFHAIHPYCREKGIRIFIVTGAGYGNIEVLNRELAAMQSADVVFTHATGVISQIMEMTPIAISANGRTVYELAHMHIPAIVLSHHAREITHRFAREENGFLNQDIYHAGLTEQTVLANLQRLVEDHAFRRELFDRVRRYNFTRNKSKVLRMILKILE